jgi:DNA processing protein
VTACDECLRRSWLLARLADPIERIRGRQNAIPGLLAASDGELLDALGNGRRGRAAQEYARFDVSAARARCAAQSVEVACSCDEGAYPQRLRDLPDPPAALFVAGGLERLATLVSGQPVAVVGARRASPYGLEVATALGRGLAAAGVTVVSGMALGADSAAHAGALAAAGPTIAVLAGGPERPYPASKRRLHERIKATGAVVSELPPGAVARRWSFPARNRIIAALSAVTVVVEAGERSGSLITATIAADIGRTVAAIPGRVTSPLAAGTNALLVDGARPVRGAQDVLDELFGAGVIDAAQRQRDLTVPPELRELFAAVAEGHDTVSRLGVHGFAAEQALAGLTELELLGCVRREAGGRYELVGA